MSYIIRCRVSGGLTGTREGILKDKNGNARLFLTRMAAEAEAHRLEVEANTRAEDARKGRELHGLRYQPRATFAYWADDA